MERGEGSRFDREILHPTTEKPVERIQALKDQREWNKEMRHALTGIVNAEMLTRVAERLLEKEFVDANTSDLINTIEDALKKMTQEPEKQWRVEERVAGPDGHPAYEVYARDENMMLVDQFFISCEDIARKLGKDWKMLVDDESPQA